MSWSCVSVEKGPGVISDQVRNEVMVMACLLAKDKHDLRKINGNHCGGVISTKWKSYLLGTTSGILFRAQLDGHDGQDYFINFLMPQHLLEEGVRKLKEMEEGGRMPEWMAKEGKLPIPEMYEFFNLRRVYN